MRVFNKERALPVLLEGTFIGDGTAARRAGINPATVTVWRKRLSEDEKLRREYDKRLEAYRKEWLKQAPSALTAGLAAYQSVAEHAAAHPEDVSAEVFAAVIQGIQTISKVTISQKYADVRLEHLKKQLDAAPTPDYLPDEQPKQLPEYHANGNSKVIEGVVVEEGAEN